MLQWSMEQKQAILAISTDITLSTKLSNSHWQLMAKVLRVQQPFEEATKETSFKSVIPRQCTNSLDGG